MSNYVKTGVAVVVLRSLEKPQILVSQRLSASEDTGIGKFAYAGGHVELQDVDLIAAALREVEEEIGVPVTIVPSPTFGHDSWFALKDDPSYYCGYVLALVDEEYQHEEYFPSREPERTNNWTWVDPEDLVELGRVSNSTDWLQPLNVLRCLRIVKAFQTSN